MAADQGAAFDLSWAVILDAAREMSELLAELLALVTGGASVGRI